MKPENYRGITLVSMLDKLFAIALCTRISIWMEDNLRANCQAGFRKDHRTSDQLFIHRTIIETSAFEKKALFCAYIDYSKLLIPFLEYYCGNGRQKSAFMVTCCEPYSLCTKMSVPVSPPLRALHMTFQATWESNRDVLSAPYFLDYLLMSSKLFLSGIRISVSHHTWPGCQ